MKPLRKIVIVGGGTAGWTAAAMLATHLKREVCRVEVVESEQIGSIGVGESTIPPFVRLIQNLGIDEQDFLRSTAACYKLGIQFVDWRERGESYFHPFGVIGRRIESHEFYQCWRRASAEGDKTPLLDFSPNAVMAKHGRFFPPQWSRNSAIGGANYAIHLDANLVGRYLRDFSTERGVVHTRGLVSGVVQREDGGIEKLQLDSGEAVEGDFFIDCTGFRALLIGETLGVGFDDWSHLLPCDRAVVVRTENTLASRPYTTATASKAGWIWRIPLREHMGHGYVYASRFCTDAEAQSVLLRGLDEPRVSEPKVIHFKSGKRRDMWRHNCLALGLSSGFIEPLESTSIHLIARGMDFFLRFFPDRDCKPALIKEYNRRMNMDYGEVRDFILLHYCLTQREDTPFWQWCRNMEIPESLRERIDLFRTQGIVREGVDELFRDSSWQAIFEGMGVRPDNYCPRVDNMPGDELSSHLKKAQNAIVRMVKTLPTHDEFLQRVPAPGGRK